MKQNIEYDMERNKEIVKISESQLHSIISKSIHTILKEEEGYKYMIITVKGEEVVDTKYITLPRPNMQPNDDDIPFRIGPDQALIQIDKLEEQNMKQTIKLNEARLKKIVAESVKRVLKENNDKEKILFQKICELDMILNQTEYRDALGLEGIHLVGIYKSLHPLLQKAIRTLKPYTK